MNKYDIKDKDAMKQFAIDFIKNIKANSIICLTGDLGAGKTFFVKSIAKAIGVKDDVTSPTFNILKTYDVERDKKSVYDKNIKKLNHFDVYRIKSNEELVDIGFFESIYEDNAISIIEWADLIKEEIPKEAIWINIRILDKDKREITVDE